jgi:SagB-type dehydrogenase family enzyme
LPADRRDAAGAPSAPAAPLPEHKDRARSGPEASAAVFSNSFKAVHPWTHSTGFRTHGLRYRTFARSTDPRVAEDFLVNTRYLRNDRETEFSIQAYFTDSSVVMLSGIGREEPAGRDAVALPEGAQLREEAGAVMSRRHSSRSYTGDALELSYLATIVRGAAAVTHEGTATLDDGTPVPITHRTTPSGGGLYPIDLYVVALGVRDLERGVYRYRPPTDDLIAEAGADDADRITECFAVPEEIITLSRANAILLFVGYPWRSMRKYGPRGLRFLFIESGSMSQNAHLAVEALGFGSVDCASFVDDELHEVLGLDGVHEAIVHSLIVGYPG